MRWTLSQLQRKTNVTQMLQYVIRMLYGCYLYVTRTDVTKMLYGFYTDVTRTLYALSTEHFKGDTQALNGCYDNVTCVLYGRYTEVRQILHGQYNVQTSRQSEICIQHEMAVLVIKAGGVVPRAHVACTKPYVELCHI